MSRRDSSRRSAWAPWGRVAAGGLGSGLGRGLCVPTAQAATTTLSLVATDGYANVPGRPGNPLYIFGFVNVPADLDQSVQLIATYKGHIQTSAPTLDFKQNDDIKITLTNLGLVQRPDLTDSHTIHWHGFDIPSPLNDGVPEVSVAVPIGKQLTYFYRPHREGTYMYHCHFEDVEHVQMGMTGIVFVRPLQDGTQPSAAFTKFAYNDGDGSTGYHRHFAILLNEFWSNFHDGDRDIQESVPTDYDPQWFTLNGRCYPETVLPNDDDAVAAGRRTCGSARSTRTSAPPTTQPAQLGAHPGEPGRAGAAAAGQPRLPAARHAAAGHPACTSIGQDASLLRNGSVDTSYWTNTLYIGPGEARDVLFDAPAYNAARPSGSDSRGQLQRLLLQEPGLAQAVEQRRRRARRHDDRGAGVPEPAARPDRREPDLCLSRQRPLRTEGRPR